MKKEPEKSLITVLVPNIKGQLAMVATFCAENNLNISRLTLSAADKDDKIQKIIAYIEGDRKNVDEVCRRLLDIETVLKLVNFQTSSEYLEKELCLLKILSDNSKLPSVANLVADFGGKVVHSSEKTTIFMVEDKEENVNSFVSQVVGMCKKIEISRSGMVVVSVDRSIDDLTSVNI
ncbi:MAG: acetolactate synthase small subunit [Rickettsiales bacterium]|jgi:acetolactate synthase-1/3 small subunit|nr:acetolactate synthase small subunit [Rickettsiales bacterium]